jgi:hypothetical protein
MRRLSARLAGSLQPSATDDLFPAVGAALTQVRGRPVRLRKAVFPPLTASGLWVDRTGHDLIVVEENTRPDHQLVIIGHEAWHMFQGHGTSLFEQGHAALRIGKKEAAGVLADLLAALPEAAEADLSPHAPMDAALHFAARSDGYRAHEEYEADHFGFRFATDMRAALDDARAETGPPDPAARIQASLAHRFRRG